MVRQPLTPEQIAAGRRLGARLRTARGDRRPDEVARAAGISPETLRKIETGRLAITGPYIDLLCTDAFDRERGAWGRSPGDSVKTDIAEIKGARHGART